MSAILRIACSPRLTTLMFGCSDTFVVFAPVPRKRCRLGRSRPRAPRTIPWRRRPLCRFQRSRRRARSRPAAAPSRSEACGWGSEQIRNSLLAWRSTRVRSLMTSRASSRIRLPLREGHHATAHVLHIAHVGGTFLRRRMCRANSRRRGREHERGRDQYHRRRGLLAGSAIFAGMESHPSSPQNGTHGCRPGRAGAMSRLTCRPR